MATMALENFRALTDAEGVALQAARALVGQWRKGAARSIVLYAPLVDEEREFPGAGKLTVSGCGCGKTHLAVGLAKKAIEMGRDVRFATETELLEGIRASYGDDKAPTEREILESLSEAWLLVWDDVGTGGVKNMEWYQDICYRLINTRYLAGTPLALTSNLAPAGLRERLGTRSWSRLTAMAECFRLDGPDRREMGKR